MCGEASGSNCNTPLVKGRSPRVRGSPERDGEAARDSGSITACAGKPSRRIVTCSSARVDHRVCGEAWRFRRLPALVEGRSPRVRGSLHHLTSALLPHGSITACAGKPSNRARSIGRLRVDHRVCGEAERGLVAGQAVEGRSPRVRGSHQRIDWRRAENGSITACAGKPRPLQPHQRPVKVDHRVCGEASR